MSTKAKRHVHKYHRITLSYDTKVWACAHPTCNHYMPKHLESMVEGKASICWSCGEMFQLNPTTMKMDKPFCNDCILIKGFVPHFEEGLSIVQNPNPIQITNPIQTTETEICSKCNKSAIEGYAGNTTLCLSCVSVMEVNEIMQHMRKT